MTLAQTTQHSAVWTPEGFVLVLTCVAVVLIPALITLITVIFNKLGDLQRVATAANTKADVQGVALVETRQKVNEIADKNPADVTPLPPMPICPPTDPE